MQNQELIDINTVKINQDLPAVERAKDYIRQIKDPYNFKCGDITVHLKFDENGATLESRLKSYLTSIKSKG
jgi:hypothetical protein